MNVKAQAMLNAARYVEETYGADALREILATCSPAVRERCATGIAITWYPLEEFIEFLVAVARKIPDLLIGEKLGAAGARANTRGVMLRIGMLLARPENVLRRAATMWRQFNDEGELSLVKSEKNSVLIIISLVRAVVRDRERLTLIHPARACTSAARGTPSRLRRRGSRL